MKESIKVKLSSKIGVKFSVNKKFNEVALKENEILLVDPFIDQNGARIWASMDADEFIKRLFDGNVPLGKAANYDNLIVGDSDGKKGFKNVLDKWKNEGLI